MTARVVRPASTTDTPEDVERLWCMVIADPQPDPQAWRAGARRVIANALRVLFAYEVVSIVGALAGTVILGGTLGPLPPDEMVLLMAFYLLLRWLIVLPGLLVVLAGIEYVARRTPHARAMTAIVAFVPTITWQLTQSGDTTGQTVILGLTAVLFTFLARLPAREPSPAASLPGPPVTQPPGCVPDPHW
jgi:hypothetical protein